MAGKCWQQNKRSLLWIVIAHAEMVRAGEHSLTAISQERGGVVHEAGGELHDQ